MEDLTQKHCQTPFALLRQCQALGLCLGDLDRLAQVYQFVAIRFAGVYRAGYKPVVNHLCGTASAVARHRPEPTLIETALLHSAYVIGDPMERSAVVAIAGTEIERTLWDYAHISAEDLERRTDHAAQNLLFLRLCNIFDELWDASHLFAPAKQQWLGLPENHTGRARVLELCSSLGLPALVEEFDALFREIDGAGSLPSIDRINAGSFRVASKPEIPRTPPRTRFWRHWLR